MFWLSPQGFSGTDCILAARESQSDKQTGKYFKHKRCRGHQAGGALLSSRSSVHNAIKPVPQPPSLSVSQALWPVSYTRLQKIKYLGTGGDRINYFWQIILNRLGEYMCWETNHPQQIIIVWFMDAMFWYMLLWHDQIKVISMPISSNTCHFLLHLRVIMWACICVYAGMLAWVCTRCGGQKTTLGSVGQTPPPHVSRWVLSLAWNLLMSWGLPSPVSASLVPGLHTGATTMSDLS